MLLWVKQTKSTAQHISVCGTYLLLFGCGFELICLSQFEDWLKITKCHFIRRQTEIIQPEHFLLIKWSREIPGSLIILYVGNRQWNLYRKIVSDRNALNLVRDNTATVIYCLIFIIATVDRPTLSCCFSSSQGLNYFMSNAFEDFISPSFFARKIYYPSIPLVHIANSQP